MLFVALDPPDVILAGQVGGTGVVRRVLQVRKRRRMRRDSPCVAEVGRARSLDTGVRRGSPSPQGALTGSSGCPAPLPGAGPTSRPTGPTRQQLGCLVMWLSAGSPVGATRLGACFGF